MIAIVDYGMGNLRSVEKAVQKVGGEALITSDPQTIGSADKVILPGVGAFCACMTNLEDYGLTHAVNESLHSGKPFLGICVGLQMLFEGSSEMGASAGLGYFPGRVIRFYEEAVPSDGVPLKVPHIGWNTLRFPRSSRLFSGLEQGASVYFVHSFHPTTPDTSLVTATSDYGYDFCCAVERDNVVATQFHPEKSGVVGLQILRNFVAWK